MSNYPRVFIGFDDTESVAFYTLVSSIERHASGPVIIVPVRLHQLRGIHSRPRDSKQSTEFSMTRFLTPFLSDYEGWSIFMDCDMVVTDDIYKLWDYRDDPCSVMCVKHADYVPKEKTKMLGQQQTAYVKKNWSSVMLFNNARCKALTSEYVNTATGLELHQFKWLKGDILIGDLPAHWNHLVDEQTAPDRLPSLLHWTVGGPWWDHYAHSSYSDIWLNEFAIMNRTTQLDTVAVETEAAAG
jgi:lipopolysaccharide biosynthesis glycosyltransferase